MTDPVLEYNSILDGIHEHNLQFLGLINMDRESAIEKIKKLPISTYLALRSSVKYHVNKGSSNNQPGMVQNETSFQSTTSETVRKVTVQQTPTNTRTDYAKILDLNTPAESIAEKYLGVRAKYLIELKALENKPGCTGCRRNSLRRKFIEELKKLDSES